MYISEEQHPPSRKATPLFATSKKRIFFGRIVHSLSLAKLEILHVAALGLDDNGKIFFLDSHVGSGQEAARKYQGFGEAEIINLKPLQFLFPGFIDTHMHAPQWPNNGLGMEYSLLDWISHLTDPIEASYSDTSKAINVYSRMVQKLLQNGSTCVAYNSSIHEEATKALADMCKHYGQRAIVGKLCIDRNSPENNRQSVEENLDGSANCVDYVQNMWSDIMSPSIEPRTALFNSETLLKGLGELAQNKDRRFLGEKIHVQCHMCEDLDELKQIKKDFPDAPSYASIYAKHGLLHEKSIVAHCIHLSHLDMEILRDTKAGVAHCPTSNTCLMAGECPVRWLLDNGVKVGLGTDCSAGYSGSIQVAMCNASNVSRHLVMRTGDEKLKLSAEEVLYLATLGGAGVVGMADKIGNFLPGKEFDALIIDLGVEDNVDVVGWEKDDLAMVKKWVFMGDDRSIRRVFVNGKEVSCKDIF